MPGKNLKNCVADASLVRSEFINKLAERVDVSDPCLAVLCMRVLTTDALQAEPLLEDDMKTNLFRLKRAISQWANKPWQPTLGKSRENVLVLYYAGHGVNAHVEGPAGAHQVDTPFLVPSSCEEMDSHEAVGDQCLSLLHLYKILLESEACKKWDASVLVSLQPAIFETFDPMLYRCSDSHHQDVFVFCIARRSQSPRCR